MRAVPGKPGTSRVSATADYGDCAGRRMPPDVVIETV